MYPQPKAVLQKKRGKKESVGKGNQSMVLVMSNLMTKRKGG